MLVFIKNYSEVSQKSNFFQNTENILIDMFYEQGIRGWDGEGDYLPIQWNNKHYVWPCEEL